MTYIEIMELFTLTWHEDLKSRIPRDFNMCHFVSLSQATQSITESRCEYPQHQVNVYADCKNFANK